MLQPHTIIFAQALTPKNKIILYSLCSYFLLIKHATPIYWTSISSQEFYSYFLRSKKKKISMLWNGLITSCKLSKLQNSALLILCFHNSWTLKLPSRFTSQVMAGTSSYSLQKLWQMLKGLQTRYQSYLYSKRSRTNSTNNWIINRCKHQRCCSLLAGLLRKRKPKRWNFLTQ